MPNFHDLDIFGYEYQFHLESKSKNYRTNCGAIASIVIGLTIGWQFYTNFENMFNFRKDRIESHEFLTQYD